MSPSALPRTPLAEIVEETSSEAEESWEEVPSFEKPKQDVDMASESETETVWENQHEIEAAQYLTSLYSDLMMNQKLTPEIAYNTMLENMVTDAQLHLLHKWDHMGRHA